MATDEDYPIDLPILVIEAQIFVAVNKFQFLPNKLIPTVDNVDMTVALLLCGAICVQEEGRRVGGSVCDGSYVIVGKLHWLLDW